MYNRTLLIGRIGHNAEAKTDKNQQEYVVLSIATKDSWKTSRATTKVAPSGIGSTPGAIFRALQRLSRRASSSASMARSAIVSTPKKSTATVKHRVAEIHAYKLQRLSKVEGQDESADEALTISGGTGSRAALGAALESALLPSRVVTELPSLQPQANHNY